MSIEDGPSLPLKMVNGKNFQEQICCTMSLNTGVILCSYCSIGKKDQSTKLFTQREIN
jgi:hypothetical protein